MRLRELLATLGTFPGAVEILDEKRRKCLQFSSLNCNKAEKWDKWLGSNDELNDAEVLGVEPYSLGGESYTTLRVIIREVEGLGGADDGIQNRTSALAKGIRKDVDEVERMRGHAEWMLYYWSGNGESDSADEPREWGDNIRYWSDAKSFFRQCEELLNDMAEKLETIDPSGKGQFWKKGEERQ